jgi:DNA-binding NarL/FixJ family response regulator
MLGDGGLREVLATAIVVLLVYLATLAFRLARLRHAASREAGGATASAQAASAPPAASAPAPASTVPAQAPAPAPRIEAPKLSPVHEQAAALAREGLDIATIARRCGISEGEAELVCWLARNRDATP